VTITGDWIAMYDEAKSRVDFLEDELRKTQRSVYRQRQENGQLRRQIAGWKEENPKAARRVKELENLRAKMARIAFEGGNAEHERDSALEDLSDALAECKANFVGRTAERDRADSLEDQLVTLRSEIAAEEQHRLEVQRACIAAKQELQTLRADLATVIGHLDGYADAFDRKITLGDAWDFLASTKSEFIAALREDADRLRQAGGEGS